MTEALWPKDPFSMEHCTLSDLLKITTDVSGKTLIGKLAITNLKLHHCAPPTAVIVMFHFLLFEVYK